MSLKLEKAMSETLKYIIWVARAALFQAESLKK